MSRKQPSPYKKFKWKTPILSIDHPKGYKVVKFGNGFSQTYRISTEPEPVSISFEYKETAEYVAPVYRFLKDSLDTGKPFWFPYPDPENPEETKYLLMTVERLGYQFISKTVAKMDVVLSESLVNAYMHYDLEEASNVT